MRAGESLTPSPASKREQRSREARSLRGAARRTGDSDDMSELLGVLDDLELVLRTGTREHDLGVAEDLVPLPSCEPRSQ